MKKRIIALIIVVAFNVQSIVYSTEQPKPQYPNTEQYSATFHRSKANAATFQKPTTITSMILNFVQTNRSRFFAKDTIGNKILADILLKNLEETLEDHSKMYDLHLYDLLNLAQLADHMEISDPSYKKDLFEESRSQFEELYPHSKKTNFSTIDELITYVHKNPNYAQYPNIEKYSTLIKKSHSESFKDPSTAASSILTFVQERRSSLFAGDKIENFFLVDILLKNLEKTLTNHASMRALSLYDLLNLTQLAEYLQISDPSYMQDLLKSSYKAFIEEPYNNIAEYLKKPNFSTIDELIAYVRKNSTLSQSPNYFETRVIAWINQHKKYFLEYGHINDTAESIHTFAQELLKTLNTFLSSRKMETEDIRTSYILPLLGIYELLQLDSFSYLKSYTFLLQQAAKVFRKRTVERILKKSGKEIETVTQDDITSMLSIISPDCLTAILSYAVAPYNKTWQIKEGHASVALSPNGLMVAYITPSKGITLLDITKESQKQLASPEALSELTFSPDNTMLMSVQKNNTVIWDINRATVIKKLLDTSWIFSPDSTMVASHSGNTITLQEIHHDTTYQIPVDSSPNKLIFSPDSTIIAALFDHKTIKLWDIKSRAEIQTLTGPADANISSLSFSPNSKIVVLASRLDNGPGTARLWDIQSGTQIYFTPSSLTRNCTAFSSNNEIFAAVNNRQTITLWNIIHNTTQILTSSSAGFFSVMFSPDNKILVSGEGYGITLWDVQNNQEINYLNLPDVTNTIFSSNGTMLAKDNVVWNPRTNRMIANQTFVGGVTSLAFISHDTEIIYIIENSRTIYSQKELNEQIPLTITVCPLSIVPMIKTIYKKL